MQFTVASAAGAVILTLAGTPVPAVAARQDSTVIPPAHVASWMSSTTSRSALWLLPPAERWGIISGMVRAALGEARDEGNAVGVVASQQAYGVAAALNAPGAPMPAITDNEVGGVVFYWKGAKREIEIELDPDSSYFVRIKNEGETTFSREGFGAVPMEAVNVALRDWANERLGASNPSFPRSA
ncbi:hypothetical protein ACIGCK_04680 [Microbacterium sp. NPDC078428]|uniref:hypothetical protein n=1 Tax=Microbacterium sp. NPDC078428 TaxID=3364190 RepID=UPI0037CB4F82